MLEHKSLSSAEFKFIDDGRGGFSGYASKFGGVDSYNDTIAVGAYAKTIPTFLEAGFIAVGHSWSDTPIAYPVEAREDAIGLFITAEFHSTAVAQDARKVVQERLAAGKSIGLSIGYSIPEGGSAKRDDGIRELREIELYEVSLVTVPADRGAGVTSAKDGLRVGLPFVDHSEAVRAAVEEFVARAQAIAGLRAKEGRELSSSNRARIAGAKEAVDDATSALIGLSADFADLLAATEPKPKGESAPDTLAATRQVYAEHLRRLSGV